MPSIPQAGKQVIIAARKWALARFKYRKMLDSKSATVKEKEKGKKALLKLTDELELAVHEFEKALRGQKPLKGKKRPIPWKEIFGFVSAGAGFAAQAMGDNRPEMGSSREPKTIDVECEVRDVP